jgi:hypothetical protein
MPGFVFNAAPSDWFQNQERSPMKLLIRLPKPGLVLLGYWYRGNYYRNNHREAIELFMNDPETEGIVMIGEIGGGLEAEAARWIHARGNKKPVVGFNRRPDSTQGTKNGTCRCYCRRCR